MISFVRNPIWLGSILVAVVAVVLFTIETKADAPEPQDFETPNGVATLEWIDNGDGTFTRQITVEGTVTVSQGTPRENAALASKSNEIARQQAKERLIAVKDQLLIDLDTPGAPELHRAIRAIIDIIEMME